jgi:hypothetical protein
MLIWMLAVARSKLINKHQSPAAISLSATFMGSRVKLRLERGSCGLRRPAT